MPSLSGSTPLSRPPEIETILTTLSRYNPETTTVLQEYVVTQCASGSYDLMANLALLKLYQFNPELMRDETVLNILAKSLTVFPEPDFTLALHLLPASLLHQYSSAASTPNSTIPLPPAADTDDQLSNSVHRLTYLNSLLELAAFPSFWRILSSDVDEEYADLVADVTGFEDAIRRGITKSITLSMRSLRVETALSWWNFTNKEAVEQWVEEEMPGWVIEGDSIVSKDEGDAITAATSTVQPATGKIKFEQFSRVIRRVYENELLHH
ncbi:armadillo-type protein [Lipomyces kononenkoae]|uniref:Armadillo-type protein n=1 Tax=Lipomyces kononenkoae TaxID=34357 RepID=A0ACC3T4G7_LIPKO